jgi:hypothetical protein
MPALAEHDRLLRVAPDQDLLVDGDRAVLALLIFLGLDRARIRQLGVELEVELLARDFGGEHPVGGVGHLVLGKVPRPFRHPRRQRRLEVGDAVAGGGRDHEDLLERQPLVELRGQRQQLAPWRDVDLVEDQDLGLAPAFSVSSISSIRLRSRSSRRSPARSGRHPARPPQAAATIARSSRRLGSKMPGVSSSRICASPASRCPSAACAWSAPWG